MAVFGYIRVSTGRQAEEGESLDVQQRQLAGYAMQHGWEIGRVFREEGISGSIPVAERPAGAEMLEAAKAGDVIIAAKLDRMFRSALDALQTVAALQKRGVALHLIDLGGDVSGNGMAKMFLTVAAAFAEAERGRIAERIATVKKDQAARGRFLGGAIPFGYRVEDGALVEDEAQQKAIRAMRKLHRRGLSLRSIAAEIGERHRIEVSHVTVGKVLRDAEASR